MDNELMWPCYSVASWFFEECWAVLWTRGIAVEQLVDCLCVPTIHSLINEPVVNIGLR